MDESSIDFTLATAIAKPYDGRPNRPLIADAAELAALACLQSLRGAAGLQQPIAQVNSATRKLLVADLAAIIRRAPAFVAQYPLPVTPPEPELDAAEVKALGTPTETPALTQGTP